MTRRVFSILLSASLLFGVAETAAQEQTTPDSPPDLTKTIDFERIGEYYLGPTGAKGWMYVNGRFLTDEARQILITDVQAGSPTEGTLQVGDVILGIGDARFDSDARKCLGRAIDKAEREENGGMLKLLRWRPLRETGSRQGKEQTVEIQLPVMGTYSETAPYDCPKTKRLLDDALEVLASRDDWSRFGIKALALLATGEEKYIELRSKAKEEGDTLGGAFTVTAFGLPPGIGSYVNWDEKLDGAIARAMMSYGILTAPSK